MTIYLLAILIILIGSYIFSVWIDLLNIQHISLTIPKEFDGVYDETKYKTSQSYLKENTLFSCIQATFDVLLMLGVILSGALNYLDLFLRGFHLGSILTGVLFIFALIFALQFLHLPFSIIHTFYIEKKYGFNKTTVKTFILDLIKGMVLSLILGGIVLSLILFFFEKSGSRAWLYIWIFITVFQLVLMGIAPIIIMPLFNKFEPLEDGSLKTGIEEYAKKMNFSLSGIFKMDGSKRSSKSNAFFTGIGKWRRIVLLDTLIAKHSDEELISILAHEVGHYQQKHIYKLMGISIITTGFTLWILSLFLNNPALFAAFKIDNLSIYASLILFGFIFTPVEMIFGIISNILSRRYEYSADKFAVSTYPQPETFITALKKLSVDNLSNLTPHPLKVFIEYSHPTVLQRIQAIRNNQ